MIAFARQQLRILLISALTLLLISGALLTALWFLKPPPRLTKENFRRIRVGMTTTQVEAIVGKRADWVGQLGQLGVVRISPPALVGRQDLFDHAWDISNDAEYYCRVWITFDEQGTVVDGSSNFAKEASGSPDRETGFERLNISPPSIVDQIRSWLGF